MFAVFSSESEKCLTVSANMMPLKLMKEMKRLTSLVIEIENITTHPILTLISLNIKGVVLSFARNPTLETKQTHGISPAGEHGQEGQ